MGAGAILGGFTMIVITAGAGPALALGALIVGIVLMAMFDVWRSPPDEK